MAPDTSTVQVSKPEEITADDLHEAYLFAGLRKLKIGLMTAMDHPPFAPHCAVPRWQKRGNSNTGSPRRISRHSNWRKRHDYRSQD